MNDLTSQTEAQSPSLWRVLTLIPNLVGYFRIALLIAVLFIAFSHPVLTFVLYFIGGNLDAVDGYLARRLNQTSKIGTILDYATDRASDIVVFMILATVYPHWWSVFVLLLMLDIFSHICQVYSTVFSTQKSHKLIGRSQGSLLSLYYTNRAVLYFTCASHDLWLGCMYLLHFYPMHWLFVLQFFLLPGFIFKVIIHLMQIWAVFHRVSAEEQI